MKDDYLNWHPHKLTMVLNRPISSLQLPEHIVNTLDNAHIHTISDLLKLTKCQLSNVPLMTDYSVDTILRKLRLL